MNRRLRGKVALVTGAGWGIGRAVAGRLAAEGAAVGLVDGDPQAGEQAACELARAGGRVVAMEADVSSADQVADAVRAIEAKFGPISILVNAAGGGDQADPRYHPPEPGLDLIGILLLTRAVLPSMQNARWGRIVSVLPEQASETGDGPLSAAARAAAASFCQTLAIQAAHWNVTVNTIASGGEEATGTIVASIAADDAAGITGQTLRPSFGITQLV